MANSDGKGQLREAEEGPPTIQAVPLPSLSLLNEAATEELGAQERRADALDAKPGCCLASLALSSACLDKLRAPWRWVSQRLELVSADRRAGQIGECTAGCRRGARSRR
jgi:hypothetical protein